MSTALIDLASPEYRLSPWDIYRRLRDEHPAYYMPGGSWDGEDLYVLSRYEDVGFALKDKTQFSSQIQQDNYMNLPMLVNRDAPEHTRLRHSTNRAFNARLVRQLSGWVRTLVDELLTELYRHDSVEFVDAYSTALPLRVVGGMLGVPLDRKADLRRWSQAVMNSFAVSAGLDPDKVPGFFEDIVEFSNYMEELAHDRRGKPNRGDILGELVEEHESGALTRDEMVTMAWSFIAAGHETTMNLLGGGIELLLRDPGLAAELRADPSKTAAFIEEYLRLNSPTQWLLRRTATEVTLHDTTIPAGALIHVVLGAANRDPRQFANPDELDLTRPNVNRHFAFGAGTHFCPGAALSRLLAETTFTAFLPVLDRFSLDVERPAQLRKQQGSYGFSQMWMKVHPQAEQAL
ncbi:cytochrome P450 [Nocardia sp. NPDC050175]|uniref:cytochrome P450 n=1 Tax=Nocardia sp. NPDC050175 TaxID=3364317 RepID=UPI00379E3A43